MRKALVLTMVLGLGGCVTTAPPPARPGLLSPLVGAGIIKEDTQTKARQVQASAKEYCQYIPTLGTVLSLFSAGVGGSAAAIATAVCDVVTTAPLADGGRRAAKLYGVPIKGKFVKRSR